MMESCERRCNAPFFYLGIPGSNLNNAIMQLLKDLRKNFAPEIDNPAEAIEQGIGGITWTNDNRRVPSIPRPHLTGLVQKETLQTRRVDTSSPPPASIHP